MTNSPPMVKIGALQGISQLLDKSGFLENEFYSFIDVNVVADEINQLIPFESFVEILEKLKQLTSIKHPGLELAKIQIQSGTVPYFDLIMSAPNIDVAVQIALRFHYIHSEVSYWFWEVENDYAIIKRRSFVPVESNDKEYCLYTIGVVYLLLKKISGEQSKFKRILLIQTEGKDRVQLENFFECQISFNQDFDGFLIDADDCYKPNKNFNSARYKALFKELSHYKGVFPQSQKCLRWVKSLILQNLGTGKCTLKDVASAMNMHPRALQRMLAKENIIFKTLVNEIRLNNAKRLLMYRDVPLTQISFMLGFSEASAFSRSFHLYEKCSPRQWRQSHN